MKQKYIIIYNNFDPKRKDFFFYLSSVFLSILQKILFLKNVLLLFSHFLRSFYFEKTRESGFSMFKAKFRPLRKKTFKKKK